jgi:hypothetical protein
MQTPAELSGTFNMGRILMPSSSLPQNDQDKDRLVLGSSLKNAIVNSLDILGPNAVDSLLHELKRNGIVFEESKNKSYTFYQIEAALSGIFGSEAAALVIGRIWAYLGKNDDYN